MSTCRPNLDTLPPELIVAIVEHVTLRHHPGLTETLHHSPRIFELQAAARKSSDCLSCISRTSSRLHHIVTPILYRAPLLLASRQVRALAQTVNCFGSQPRSSSLAPAPYIRGLLITPFDGYLSADETTKDSYAWGPALEAILHSDAAKELQMLSIVTSTQGPALRTLCSLNTKGRPRIAFINHLSSAAKPLSRQPDLDFSVFSHVTHLHLSQMILTDSVLTDFPCLTHLRLAGLPHQALTSFSAQQHQHDSQSPPPESSRRRSVTSNDAAHMLLSLVRALAQTQRMKLLQLELARLSALDPPQRNTSAAGQNGDGAPFEQFAAPGQLATIDFPADVPMDAAEAERWAAEDERSRTAERDGHWMQLRDGLEDVRTFAHDVWREVRQWSGEERRSEEDIENSPWTRSIPHLQIDVVGARPAGWSDAEACVDFLAHASSLWSGEASDEGAAGRTPAPTGIWADEDVFHLAETRPWLAYARRGEEVGAEADGENDRRDMREWRYLDDGSWWTGELPRVDAGLWEQGRSRV